MFENWGITRELSIPVCFFGNDAVPFASGNFRKVKHEFLAGWHAPLPLIVRFGHQWFNGFRNCTLRVCKTTSLEYARRNSYGDMGKKTHNLDGREDENLQSQIFILITRFYFSNGGK